MDNSHLIERVAKAMHKEWCDGIVSWDHEGDRVKSRFLKQAETAITEMNRQGEDTLSEKDPQIPDIRWKEIWERYHSEINIEVTHCLTEPVCPTAVIVIEHPRQVLKNTACVGDTISEAVQNAYNKFTTHYTKDG